MDNLYLFSFKDGAIISEKNERYQVVRDHADRGFYELLIPDVKQADAGPYKCVASNIWGEESSEAVLSVTSKQLLLIYFFNVFAQCL